MSPDSSDNADGRPSRNVTASTLNLVSQILNSASNFIFTALVARSQSLAVFGQFSVGFLGVTMGIFFLRSTASQVLLLRCSESDNEASGYFSAQMYASALLAAVVVVVTQVVSLPPAVTAIMAISCVVVVAQDSLRYIGLSQSKSATVVLSDSIWLSLMVGAGIVLIVNNAESLTTFIVVWLGSGLIALLAFTTRSFWVTPRGGYKWICKHRNDLRPLSGEAILSVASGNLGIALISTFAGYASVGVLRSAQLAMAPMATLSQAVTVGLLQARRTASPKHLESLRWWLTPLAFLWGSLSVWVLMLTLLSGGPVLLGPNWEVINSVIWVAVVAQVSSSLSLVSLTRVKVLAGPKQTFRYRLITFWIEPTTVTLLATFVAVTGAVYGSALAQLILACLAVLFGIVTTRSGRSTHPIRSSRR